MTTTAAVLIDATGDANVVTLASGPVEVDPTPQTATLNLRASGYDVDRLDDNALNAAFAAEGCDWLHLVDLNGAFEGVPVNGDVVRAIAAAFPGMPIQIGGGIRGGKRFKAIQTGGPSGGFLPESELDLQVDFGDIPQFLLVCHRGDGAFGEEIMATTREVLARLAADGVTLSAQVYSTRPAPEPRIWI